MRTPLARKPDAAATLRSRLHRSRGWHTFAFGRWNRRPLILSLPIACVIVAAIWFVLVVRPVAADPLTNGGFETGDLNGWLSIGDVTVVDRSFLPTPEGNFQLLMSNAPGLALWELIGPSETFSGTASVPSEQLAEFFFGAPGFRWQDVSPYHTDSGSGVMRSFTANAGDILSFRWNYLTDEASPGPGDSSGCAPSAPDCQVDFSFVVLDDTIVVLAGSNSQFLPSTTGFRGETGVKRLSMLIPTTGQHTVGFGIVDTVDFFILSALLIDDVTLARFVPAEADSFLRQGAPNTNEGANPALPIQDAGNNRVLMAFDLTGVPLNRVMRATLVLTISENADNWKRSGDRTVDAHPLPQGFIEGNGKSVGVPRRESERGTGPGTTWACAIDDDIANQRADCDETWRGGDFGPATAPPVVHSNGLAGDVAWDVTGDVLAGSRGWLIKKTNEGASGQVTYHSREGSLAIFGDLRASPRLFLEFSLPIASAP